MLVISIFIIMFTNTLNKQQKHINLIFLNRIIILSLLLSILLNLNTLDFQSIGKGLSLYNDLFQVTALSQIIEFLLLGIGAFILFGWSINREDLIKINSIQDQYALIALFSLLGGALLMSSLDLLSMYLCIELQSFSLYILATLSKNQLSATSAGLKYFLLGSLSSCFILLGAAIIYSYTGLTHFESIQALFSCTIEDVSQLDLNNIFSLEGLNVNYSIIIGIVIILMGFLFKVSAAPFHQWAPDVYDGTPTIVTVWLTIIAKLTIFIFLFEFIGIPYYISELTTEVFKGVQSGYDLSISVQNLLLITSLLSLIIGTVGGLSQIKIKRLLAFSSISHVGFLLLALGIYNQRSIDSFIFYLIQYSITSLNIFLIILALGYVVKNSSLNLNRPKENLDLNYLWELKGLFNQNIVLSFSLAICLFSMAGIPPLIGFFSKQFVLFSSIENGNNFLAIIAILVSVISASYYLKLVKLIYFDSSNETEENKGIIIENSKISTLELSNTHSYIISALTFVLSFFFINPSIVLNGTQLISITIFNI